MDAYTLDALIHCRVLTLNSICQEEMRRNLRRHGNHEVELMSADHLRHSQKYTPGFRDTFYIDEDAGLK